VGLASILAHSIVLEAAEAAAVAVVAVVAAGAVVAVAAVAAVVALEGFADAMAKQQSEVPWEAGRETGEGV
jgi:hypothetical protein